MVLANVVFPLVFLQAWTMLLAFGPVVIVEAAILARFLRLPYARGVGASLIANLISSVLGVPLAGLLYSLAGDLGRRVADEGALHAFLSALVYPPEGNETLFLAAWIAGFGLLFLLTAAVEGVVLRLWFRERDGRRVLRAVWLANGASYLGLVAITVTLTLLL